MTETNPSINRIVSGLAALKIATYLNVMDHDFSRDGNNIIYFIDADVFGLLIETPSEKLGRIRPDFGEAPLLGLFDDAVTTSPYLPAEYETVEYIFSGYLPGQGGASLYLSEGHLGEVERIKHAVMGRKPRGRKRANSTTVDDNEAARLLSEFSDEIIRRSVGGFDNREIDELSGRATELTRSLFEPEHETRAPRAFQSTETVLAIARAAKHYAPGFDLPDYEKAADGRQLSAVTDWCARLASNRAGQRFRTSTEGLQIYNQFHDHVRKRILDDARTLSDIVELNRSLPRSRRAVLITGTAWVHRAYMEWFSTNGKEKAVENYHLRQPIQYTPLINLSSYNSVFSLEMDDAKSGRAFRDIVSLLDSFLDPLNSSPSFLSVLEKYTQTGGRPTGPLHWWSEYQDLSEIANRWDLAYRNATLITLPVLMRRRELHDQILRDALKRAGGDLLTAQNSIIAKLELEQMSSSMLVLAREVRDELTLARAPAARFKSVRVVLPVLLNIPNEISHRLAGILDGGIDHVIAEIRQTAAERVTRAPQAVDVIKNIVISMSLGSWHQAKRLSEQAEIAFESDMQPFRGNVDEAGNVMAEEMRYLYAVTVRFDCLNIQEFQTAQSLLEAVALNINHDCELRRSRSLVELGTLKLVAAIHLHARERLGSAATWPSFIQDTELPTLDELLATALVDLRTAFSKLEESYIAGSPAHARSVERLRLQAAINGLCAFVMAHLTQIKLESDNMDFVRQAFGFVRPAYEAGTQLRPIGVLDFEACRKVLLPDSVFPDKSGRELLSIYLDNTLFEEYPIYKRLIVGSDLDLSRLYQAGLQ